MNQNSQLPPIILPRENYDDEEGKVPSKSHEESNSRDMSSPQREGGLQNEQKDTDSQDNKSEEEVKDQEYYDNLAKKQLEEELLHTRKDMWFTKLIVNYTWIVLSLSIAFTLFFTLLCVVLGGFNVSEQHERDYLVWSSKEVQDWDKYELAKEAVQTNYPDGIQPLRTSVNERWATSITFECNDCDTILTSEFIKQMYSVEQAIVNNEDYINFCKAVSSSDSSCDPSAYNSFSKNFASNIATLTQTDVDTFLQTIANTEQTYLDNNIYLESTFTQSNLVSKKARAIYLFASPIQIGSKRYKSYTDDEAGQNKELVKFSNDLKDVINGIDNDLKVELYNFQWYEGTVDGYVMQDFSLAVLSFMFVLLYVSFHLKSFFLAGTAMTAIAFSYPLAIFVNKFIFQVSYFQTINFVAVFVILGISADNVFVFTDSWQQSGQHEILNPDKENKYNNLLPRMNHTWRKASKAISTTSFTTAMAFLATGFSKIMPISAFGFFASTLVAMNYIFAIVTFPWCLIIFERYLAHRCRYRALIANICKKTVEKCRKNDKENSISPENREENEGGDQENKPNEEQLQVESLSAANQPQEQQEAQSNQEEVREAVVRKQSKLEDIPEGVENEFISEERFIEKFFRVHWNYWVAKLRWVIIAFVIVWTALAIWRVTEFEPATEALQMLPDAHWLNKLQESLRNDYHTGENDDTIQVSFLWGIKGVDRSKVDSWDATDRGKIEWDSEFDLSPETNQQRVVDIWNDLKNNALVKDKSVTCWVEDFLNARNGGNPIPQANFYTELQAYLATTDGQNKYNDNQIGYINNTLYFIRIEALAIAKPFQGYRTNYPIYEDWEAQKNIYNEASPIGVNNALQTAGNDWAFLISEREFVNGAIQGTLIALSFSFVVLLISTLNIVMAIYATASISCIVISVIALMEILGWSLGVIESIAIVILIGFSVDYAVHLANHYVESVYDDRFRRMQDALGGIGISIFSGAITTLGSGFFLFFAIVMFFQQFAILITSTILFSLMFSLGFFSALNHAVGPVRKVGDLKYYVILPIYNKIKSWITQIFSKKDANEEPNNENENPIENSI